MEPSPVLQQIEHGLAALHLADPPGLAERLEAYVALLAKWNEAYNLTAVRAPQEMVTRHLMDSLAVLPFIGGDRVIDVGTGAGLPGLVLAMARPEQQFVVLDSSGKKIRFVEHAVSRLHVGNVTAIKARAEEYRDAAGFSVVLSRAFAALADFVRIAGHLAGRAGRLLAMKGAFPEAELGALPAGWRLVGAHRLKVPGLAGQRHLIELAQEAHPA